MNCPGHGHNKDFFHTNPADCPEVRELSHNMSSRSRFSNPGLEGNPHFIDLTCLTQPGDQQIAATLALAYEQRTANMIALLVAGFTDVQIAGVDYTVLADKIVERMQPANKREG